MPIYKPPTIINLDTWDIPHLEWIPDTMTWLWIAHPKDDEYSDIWCDPSYYHLYYVPEIHNFAPKVEMYVKPERDPNYKCEGIHAFFHWSDGYSPERHVRIAISIQLGKDIVVNDKGGLCFYATWGIKPEPLPLNEIELQI